MEKADLQAVLVLAERAGASIKGLREKRSDLATQKKKDGSPVTEADLLAHRLITEGLATLSSLPVLSEEDPVDWSKRQHWQSFWLVDPLDGTKDFTEGSPDYTVNIALIEKGQPVWGVVHVPETGETFSGGKNQGATKNGQAIQARKSSTDQLKALDSRFHQSHQTKQLYQRLSTAEVLRVGSSRKFCLIADGAADLYLRTTPTSLWDVAAGQAVLEGAGGLVLTWPEQRSMNYSQENLLNPQFIAFGDASLSTIFGDPHLLR